MLAVIYTARSSRALPARRRGPVCRPSRPGGLQLSAVQAPYAPAATRASRRSTGICAYCYAAHGFVGAPLTQCVLPNAATSAKARSRGRTEYRNSVGRTSDPWLEARHFPHDVLILPHPPETTTIGCKPFLYALVITLRCVQGAGWLGRPAALRLTGHSAGRVDVAASCLDALPLEDDDGGSQQEEQG